MKKTAFALATAFTLGTASFAATTDAASHTVQSGDTLWGISQAYNTSVNQIMQDNDLQSTVIFPNEVLEVNTAGSKAAPQAAATTTSTYTVAPGDSLAKISQKFNIAVGSLVAWNGIASADDIYAGDVLALNAASKHLAKVTTVQVAQTAKAVPVAQQKVAQPAAKSQAKSQQAAKSAPAQTQAQSAPAGDVAKTITMSATAYTAYCNGCSGVTANGTDLRANPGLKVIAVDPRVIPLGTKVWVEGYGTAIAADTGGAIKGNKIDVFIPSQEGALAWGRKTVTVKILN